MRMTNKEKFDAIYAELTEKGERYIDSIFPDGRPAVYFKVGRGYEVEEVKISKWIYSFQIYQMDKPTTKDVEAINAYASSNIVFEDKNVSAFCEHVEKRGDRVCRSSWSQRLTDIRKNEQYSFDPNALTEVAAAQKEKYTLKDGDIACAYCRRAFPKEKAFRGHIYSIANYGRGGKDFDYCSPTCHGHDQMAHEG